MSCHIFIDDSGSKGYATPYSKDFVDTPPPYKGNEAFWRENYFVLCGVRVGDEDIPVLNEKINSLKLKYFGTNSVEIKSTWLRIPDKRKKHYLEPFQITPEKLNDFGEAYTKLIADNRDKITLFAVVFDKRWYGPKRATPEGIPLLKTAQILFERVHSYCGKDCYIVFDQMEASLSVDKGMHNKLRGVYVKNDGLDNIYVPEYTNIKDVTFKRSSSENFLQVADVCAYSIARQFIVFGRDWLGNTKNESGAIVLPTYPYFDMVRCNFFAGGILQTKVRGYGLVCVPDVAKINWDLHSKCSK